MNKTRWFAVSAGIAVLALAAWNFFGAFYPVSKQLAQDPRNEKVTMWAHYQYGLMPGSLVVDLRGFSAEAASIDVMRALLQSAYAHREHSFERVVLAFQGNNKFMLEGKYYRTLGQEYESQNPVYTLRTFPENVYRLDGKQAYSTWTGGVLGVLARQMDDLNQFSKDWYLDDAVKAAEAARK